MNAIATNRARSPRGASLLLLIAALVGTWTTALAQCTPQWQTGPGIPGTNHHVTASGIWNAPGSAKLVIAGWFTQVLDQAMGGVVAKDLATGQWQSLGLTEGATIHAITTMANGDLVVAGDFDSLGPSAIRRIARWDGTSWHAVFNTFGPDDTVNALAVLPNGDLVAGGTFRHIDGIQFDRIARWDGATWAPMGAGMDWVVHDLEVLPAGELLAAGGFSTAGSAQATGLATWNGTTWQPYAAGLNFGTVRTVAQHPSGDLILGGAFSLPGVVGFRYIARWDGLSFHELGGGLDDYVRAIAVAPNGDIVAGGDFGTAGVGVPATRIARWNGTWNALGEGINAHPNSTVNSLTQLPSGELIVAGGFASAGGPTALNVASWDSGTWSAIGAVAGLDKFPRSLAVLANGDLVAAGDFRYVDTTLLAERIALHDGSGWHAIGGTIDGQINTVLATSTGELIAAGNFTTIGGIQANGIARWDGTSWHALGLGLNASVSQLAELPGGSIAATGTFTMAGGTAANYIAQWDGASWSPLGSGLNSLGNALTVTPAGDLICGGLFTAAGGTGANRIARWDGTAWHSLQAPFGGSVRALQALPDGRIVAGGDLTEPVIGAPATAISIYDPDASGGTWGPVASQLSDPSNYVNALSLLPNGDLIAAGTFTESFGNGRPDNSISRWDGTAWQPLGDGVLGPISCLATAPDGTLHIGGSFQEAGGEQIRWLTKWTPTCPASAVTIGSSCAGSGGTNLLAATDLPWLGADYRAEATGMPNNSLVLSAYSLAPVSLPLATIFGQAAPNCELSVIAEFLDVLLPSAGVAQTSLSLPNDPALAARTFVHQVVPFEFDAQGNLTRITSSNGLELTIGSYE